MTEVLGLTDEVVMTATVEVVVAAVSPVQLAKRSARAESAAANLDGLIYVIRLLSNDPAITTSEFRMVRNVVCQ